MPNSTVLLGEILGIALDAAPWLVLGLLAAGLVKAFVPETRLQQWLGGRGLGAVSRAAVIGAPLPLCSCGAIPTALALHRGGAGRGPTTAFLIGTPGIGTDSLAITYALLGPLMAVARGLGAVVAAIATGMLVGGARKEGPPIESAPRANHGCCEGSCGPATASSSPEGSGQRIAQGMGYAFGDVLDDIGPWLLAGLVVAGIMITFITPDTMAGWGSGLLPMLVMALVGIPMYICATAATPIAAGLIVAGMSPGTALVFLLAGPVTSLSTLGVLRKELGNDALLRYLGGILASALLLGLLTDFLLGSAGWDITAQMDSGGELLPAWLEWTALSLLVGLALGRRLMRKA